MPWAGLISALKRRGRGARATYKNLVLRIEDNGEQPGWLARVYEGETLVAEASADGPEGAATEAVRLAKERLRDPMLALDSFDWVQM